MTIAQSTAAGKSGIRIKSRIKAGGLITQNHNQTVRGIRIKSRVRAGGLLAHNHNQAVKGLRVKSRVRAGAKPTTPDPNPK